MNAGINKDVTLVSVEAASAPDIQFSGVPRNIDLHNNCRCGKARCLACRHLERGINRLRAVEVVAEDENGNRWTAGRTKAEVRS